MFDTKKLGTDLSRLEALLDAQNDQLRTKQWLILNCYKSGHGQALVAKDMQMTSDDN